LASTNADMTHTLLFNSCRFSGGSLRQRAHQRGGSDLLTRHADGASVLCMVAHVGRKEEQHVCDIKTGLPKLPLSLSLSLSNAQILAMIGFVPADMRIFSCIHLQTS
jgi:hypothetical protein